MEGSAFLREQATAATAHKDTLGRTVRSVSNANTQAYAYSLTPPMQMHIHTHVCGPALGSFSYLPVNSYYLFTVN